LNVWKPIPLKLNRELEERWKCNKVVFLLIDCASLRCFDLPKLRFCETRLRVQVFSSWRRQHLLILPLIDQLRPLLCHNRSWLWDFEFHWRLWAFKWVKSSLFKFESFNILLKSLVEKNASVMTIYNQVVYLPNVSVQEILYTRCILGHEIGGFWASEGLPNNTNWMFTVDYANYGN